MPRIPLDAIIEALEDVSDPDDPETVILNTPTYFMLVDGKVNVIFGVNPNSLFGATKSETIKTLQNQKIPKVWQ